MIRSLFSRLFRRRYHPPPIAVADNLDMLMASGLQIVVTGTERELRAAGWIP